ncbi:MAG: hypothetical protein AAB573_05445 [Patescibacteria group bacterium]
MSTFETHSPQEQKRARSTAFSIRLSREQLVELLYAGLAVSVILFVAAAVIVAGSSSAWVLSPFAFTAWAATGVASFIAAFILECAIKSYRK